MKAKYFTTPIFYASGNPHAGHFYALLVTNILKFHYEHRGFDVKVLTGLDEHGEKIERKAKELGMPTQTFVDSLVPVWKTAMEKLDLTYDIFMRTTSPEHKENVKNILNSCYKKGDIYFGEHSGNYCVDCEEFLTSAQMDEEKKCLIHKKQTEVRLEGNYFFRFTKYRQQVIELVKENKIVVQPRYRNELLSMLESLDSDLSISRPKTRTKWGIELPFDDKHVTYVWFDALPNYVTGVGGVNEATKSEHWNNCTHIIGKEILKFHGGYWPAMLLSLGLPVPKLFVTGFMLAEGHKMSKSLGNVLSQDDIAPYGRDAYTNAALRMAPVGEDFELSMKLLLERYNSDLANGIGNLFSRTLAMVEKYFDKKIPAFQENFYVESEKNLAKSAHQLVGQVETAFDEYRPSEALAQIWQLIAECDKYITEQKPWTLTKPEDKTRLSNVLSHCVAVLRVVGFVAGGFFPEKMKSLLAGIGEDVHNLSNSFERSREFYNIKSGYEITEIPKLYMRQDIVAELAKRTETKTSSSIPVVTSAVPISIDDFSKIEMRVGTVVKAELVDGSDKLLRLQISLGDLGMRQVFSGIRQWVKPEDIANRKVIVVTNLQPRKMKFGMSEGMVLSTETLDGDICPVYASEVLKEGAKLS